MAEQRFEQNILLPIVIEFEAGCEIADKYDYYCNKMSPKISYHPIDSEEDIHLVLLRDFDGTDMDFLYIMARYHIDRSDIRTERINKAENSLRHFLLTERGYKLEQKIEVCEYAEDHQVYSLIKETWIGDMIRTMASLRDILEQRRKAEEKDLFCLLTE
jgi:hypothetical protein